ncbi:nuclease-related domain-containing protein [Lentibacillus sediminis]|uniref:nuclease-related domain-containing protein n=1 Tax=Lentibacillus sediminis TaxID=1940529 RepID=UPI000C1BAD2D|nr:nuclease-related domain-containing protein [Lentibacillus sediminis]
MVYKPRTKPAELLLYEILDTRTTLPSKEKQQYLNLKKGYEGECIFDFLLEKLQYDCLLLNDLLLTVKGTTFQIDSVLITAEMIYLFEVKNYEGDFYYEGDTFFKKPRQEWTDPLIQLSRSESLLRQLLHQLGFVFPINANVVFINKEFTLYQAPLDQPIIFPTQLKRYLNKLNSTSSKLTRKHKLLADKLVALHIQNSPYTKLPSYDYDQLHKGITCANCGSFEVHVKSRNCVCEKCGQGELVADAVMRSVGEFRVLFPERKVTTSGVHEWCGIVESRKRINRILEHYFKKVGQNRWIYFE